MTESGAKAKEQWVFNQEKESWYYLKSDGQKAQKEWIQQGQEKYYLKEDGKMAKDEWITQGENQYYINSQGKMLKNAWLGKSYISEMVIRLNKPGFMMTTIAVGSTFNKMVPMLKIGG